MGMGFAPTWLRQVPPPASHDHFNHWLSDARAAVLPYFEQMWFSGDFSPTHGTHWGTPAAVSSQLTTAVNASHTHPRLFSTHWLHVATNDASLFGLPRLPSNQANVSSTAAGMAITVTSNNPNHAD